MCTEPHRWHYDYSRLAWDTGFCFDSYNTQKVFDRNGIALLDIERIIRERDIAIVDHHIQNILEYKLDIEETRILDPNFVKLFRLSQLAVEYLTYCKKYLDSTIAIIKQDLQKANEENAELKHDLVNYQSEIHKWRKKVKDLKSTLLIHQKYQPTAACLYDGVATFQCNACAKVFVNDEYLKAHVTRRHSSNELEPKLLETENSAPVNTQYKAETDRLQMEIKELKEKLNSRERYFKNEEEKSMKLNEDGGTVQSEEYYKRMENLHEEFELFKTQYEAEMKVIRKGEQDKYDKWMEKIVDKLDTNSAKAQNVAEEENKSKSGQNADQLACTVQSESVENKLGNICDLKCKEEEQIDDKNVVAEEETNEDASSEAGEIHISMKQETTIREESISTDTKTPEKKTVNNLVGDISKVKEEVGKELEEKTKQNIEKLGEQLSEQMSDTFGLLQTRMETFWNKLQEIEVQRDKEHTLLLTHTQRTAPTPPTPKIRTELPPNTAQITQESFDNSSTQDSVTNSEESETESNCHEPQTVESSKPTRPTMIPVHKTNEITAAVISELKTKVEQKSTKMQHIVQKPNVQKIFSKPLVEKSVISSSESESTDSDSEETRSESEPVVVKQGVIIQRPTKVEQKTSVVTKKCVSAARPKAEVLQQFRKLVEEEFDERQRDLGLDPEWSRLPDRTYKHKSDILTHQRTLMVKEIPELHNIRENIIRKYDIQLATTDLSESPNLTPEPDITTRPSRFKSLFLNMRNKAKSMIRQERMPSAPVNTTTGIYKLTVHRDSPKHTVPKPTTRTRANKSPRTNSKQSMYETESENASEPEQRKTRTLVQGERRVLRKTKSETNMMADDKPAVETTNSSMVRSLSNLDSILEIKKELSNVRESESSSENIREVIAVSPRASIHTIIEKDKCKLENVSSDMESEDFKEERAHKSAFKNYPCTVKKKVLFDLHNDEQNVEIHDERSNKQVVDRKSVKSNSLFQNGGNDSSTSIDSDILDFHKTESKIPGSGDTISTRALINVTAKAQDDGSDWDISDIVK